MGLMAINCYNPCSRTIISPNIVRRVIRQHHSEVHRNNNVMTEIISQKTEPLLIVTDLDGTMLNHEDYRFDEAVPALERAHAAGIPVILNTSKPGRNSCSCVKRLAIRILLLSKTALRCAFQSSICTLRGQPQRSPKDT